MEFRLLGPLEVSKDGGSVPLGGAKQRALLAMLLLHANEAVSRDTLIEALWAQRLPGDAAHSLDVQVSRLRRTLGTELLATTPTGYVLHVEPEKIDARRFERLLESARRANAEGDPESALESLRQGLALWRGPALADVAYDDFARAAADRLEELRLVATEETFDAELALSRHETVVAELDALAAKHPLRERLRAQLMLALYRSGRAAEALRVYGDTRRRLVDELGLEPGPALQQLEQAVLRQDPALDAVARGRLRRRRGTVLVGIALGLASAAAGAGLLLAQGGTDSSRAQGVAEPESVALVAVDSGKLIGQSPMRAVVLSAYGEGAFWNLAVDGELSRVDPETGEIVKTIGTGFDHPAGIAVGEGSVWVTDCCTATLLRIDAALNVVADRIRLPTTERYFAEQTGEVAVGAGSVWVGQGFANPSYVLRLDPRTGRLLHRIRIPEGGAQGLAFGDAALWVAGPVLGYLSKIDPRTNRIVATEQTLHPWMCCVAVGGGYVWASINPERAVWKISQTGRVLTTIRLPAPAENLSYGDGAVWASAGRAGRVVRIDPTTNATRTFRVGHHVYGATAHGGVLVVGVQRSAQDVTAGLRGRVVHIALKEDSLDSTDPLAVQTAFNPPQVSFHYATCAKLLDYPDAEGAAGRTLVPEVAAAWPAVSDGGRTYTFVIRSGFRFSPPSREAVTAESFRHEIERVLSPKIPGPWMFRLLSDVVGAQAYRSGKDPHVSGVTVHGDRLAIRVVRPAPDLPARLALPSFCAVPVRTPVVPGGIEAPIPSAGPYYIAARADNVVVLKPNPNYGGSRPRRLDAIVYEWGLDVGVATARLARGKIDYVSARDPALAPDTPAARGAGRRYSRTTINWTRVLALNTHRSLFADARVRRAVAYGIDRRTLARSLDVGGLGAIATSHILPTSFLGYRSGRAYPLGGDVAAARRLAAGARNGRRAVLAAYADADGKVFDGAFVEALRAQLAAVGIALTVQPLPQTDLGDRAKVAAALARADIVAVERNASDAVDPVVHLRSLPYGRTEDHARLERIDRLPHGRRETAAAALAADLERDAVYVGYAYYAMPELVSKRLGCLVHHPAYPGLDIAALCLR
jgi:DNA-binding SARP family transcriptional activator/ABC-type transport system substrate-binding protein/streptogramin lyase